MCLCTCVFCELTDTFPSVTPGMFCLIFFFYLFLSTFYKTKSLEGSYQRFCLEDDTTYFRILSMRIMRMRKSSPSSNKHPSLYPCSPSQRDSCPLEALMSVGPAGIFSVWPAHSQLEGMQNLFTLLLWLWKQVYVFFFFFLPFSLKG